VPTLLLKDGFKFFFYANEHEPQHVHVMKGGNFCKVELSTLRVTQNYMKAADLKKVLVLVEEHRKEFGRSWNAYFKR